MKKIILDKCPQISDEGLRFLLDGRSRTSLKKLEIWSCQGISNKGLEYLARLTSLKDLNLNNNKNITDEGLFFLAYGQIKESLKFLDLRGCDNITCNGMRYLVDNCSNLKVLIIDLNTQEKLEFADSVKTKTEGSLAIITA